MYQLQRVAYEAQGGGVYKVQGGGVFIRNNQNFFGQTTGGGRYKVHRGGVYKVHRSTLKNWLYIITPVMYELKYHISGGTL